MAASKVCERLSPATTPVWYQRIGCSCTQVQPHTQACALCRGSDNSVPKQRGMELATADRCNTNAQKHDYAHTSNHGTQRHKHHHAIS